MARLTRRGFVKISGALAAVPDAGALRWELAAAAGRRQRTEEADLATIEMVDRYVLLAGRGELYSALARLARSHLDYERGIALLEQSAAVIPNNASAHKALGRAYLEDGRELPGYTELVVALMLDPADVETLTEIGRLHLTAGRSARALAALEGAVAVESGGRAFELRGHHLVLLPAQQDYALRALEDTSLLMTVQIPPGAPGSGSTTSSE